MFSLLRADLFKLRKRAMGWAMLVILALFVPLLMLTSAATQPSSTNYDFTGSLLGGIAPLSTAGTLIVIILGAIIVGSEYGYDTWKNLLTRRPGRVPFIISKWLVMVVGTCIALVMMMLLGAIIGKVIQSTMHTTGLPLQLSPAGVIVSLLMQILLPLIAGSIAILGAVLWRSSAAGIVLGIAWYLIDILLAGLIPLASASYSIVVLDAQITSYQWQRVAMTTSMLGGPANILPGLVVLFYLVVPLAAAAVLFQKRDMLGVA